MSQHTGSPVSASSIADVPIVITSVANGDVLTYESGEWVNRAGSSGAVSSVSNSDGTLTISPTTGAVVASLSLGHANSWTALQTFEPATSVTAIAILGEQTTSATAMANIIYTSTDSGGLAAGTYPFIQSTAGDDLFIGVQAGNSNVGTVAAAANNVGIGYQALYSVTEASGGIYNTAVGSKALYNNIKGYSNVAVGYKALYSVNAESNVAVGRGTLENLTTGVANVGVGEEAGRLIIDGTYNTAIGYQSMYNNLHGTGNTAIGQGCLINFSPTAAVNSYMTAIGPASGFNYGGSEVQNITIGFAYGLVGESNMLRIGNPNAPIVSGQVAFSLMGLTGFGLSPIYGLDNRFGLTAVDGAAITLYTTTATHQLYKITSRVFITAGTTPSATYSMTWTEGGIANTRTATASAIDTAGNSFTILVQPDNGTAITSQLTAISGTGATVNVAASVEQMA